VPGPLRSWERDWLTWARPIVRAAWDFPEHVAWCQGRIASKQAEFDPEGPAGDPTLRWPGYVGSDWTPGDGILFVGSVHADFERVGRGAPLIAHPVSVIESMAAANIAWRDNPAPSDLDDLAYLTATQLAYQALVPGWLRSSLLTTLLGRMLPNVAEEDVYRHAAWTNLAHCRARQSRLDEGPLQRRCAAQAAHTSTRMRPGMFPVADVVRALRPALVLSSVTALGGRDASRYWGVAPDSTSTIALDTGTFMLVAFNGNPRKPPGGDWHGERPEEWLPQVVAQLQPPGSE